jgi:formamidopyrimidine-DNA glycosylase
MPELPEVTALADFLDRKTTGLAVARVDPVAFSALKTFSPPLSALAGLTVVAAGHRGKFVTVNLGTAWIAFHLSRAGWLQWHDSLPTTAPRPGKGPLALRVLLSNGAGWDLTEAGTQKRLAVYVVTDPEEVPGIARLGPEPLDPGFTVEALKAILAGRHKQIKGLLTEQTTIAGIGNAYSDEILHAAKLSPYALSTDLDDEEIERLAAAINSELARGLELREAGASDEKTYRVHRRLGEPCHVCGTPLAQVDFEEHTIYYCPTCQTGGRVLKDRRLSRLLR